MTLYIRFCGMFHQEPPPTSLSLTYCLKIHYSGHLEHSYLMGSWAFVNLGSGSQRFASFARITTDSVFPPKRSEKGVQGLACRSQSEQSALHKDFPEGA